MAQKPVYDGTFRKHPLVISADALLSLADWDATIKAYEKARAFFQDKKNWVGYVYSLNQIGYCYRRSRNYEEASYYFKQAMHEGSKLLGSNHPELGRTYHHLAWYHYSLRQMDSAKYFHLKGMELREASLPPNHIDLAESYHGMGSFYRSVESNYVKAQEYYRKAVDIKQKALSRDDPDLAYSYQYLGISYRDRNDFFGARTYLEEAVRIYDINPNVSPNRKFNAINSLANTYYDGRNYPLAEKYYLQAIKYHVEDLNGDSIDISLALSNLGETYRLMGNIDLSEKVFLKTIDLLRKAGPDYIINLSDSYEQYAFVLMNKGKIDLAKDLLNKSLEIRKVQYDGKHKLISDLYFWLTDADILNKDYKSGLRNIQNAIIQVEEEFNNEDIYSYPDIENSNQHVNLFNLLNRKTELFYLIYLNEQDQNALKESFKLLIMLDELSDIIRNSSITDKSKLILSANFKTTSNLALGIIQDASSILPNEDCQELAFRFIEKSRYSQLYNNLARVQSISTTNLPDSLFQLENSLATKIADHQLELLEANNEEESNRINASLFRLAKQHQDLQELLADQYPSYFDVKYDSILFSLNNINEKLRKGNQIIEYFWGDSTITILSITNTKSQLINIPRNDKIINLLTSYRDLISSGIRLDDNMTEIYKEYSIISNQLYKILLGPVLEKTTSKLIISPDGPLTTLPFETLVLDDSHSNFQAANYLIKQVDVQYIYSANLLYRNKIQVLRSDPSILALSYSNGNEKGTSGRSNNLEIPATAMEVLAISKIFKGNKNNYLTGEDASETAFKQLAPQHQIIHLAVHGFGDTTIAIKSRLEFKTTMDSLNDGKLYSYELYNLNLSNLRMAVLSACESGIGKEQVGEGIFSMARGFAFAGCPTAVMSLWKVNDITTSKLMEMFYDNLTEGLEVSEALRQAKIEYISNADTRAAFPAYWAAFVMIGDDTPIMRAKSIVSLLWLLAIPIILIIGFGIRRRRA